MSPVCPRLFSTGAGAAFHAAGASAPGSSCHHWRSGPGRRRDSEGGRWGIPHPGRPSCRPRDAPLRL